MAGCSASRRSASASRAAHALVVVDACYAGTGRDGAALLEGKRLAVDRDAFMGSFFDRFLSEHEGEK